MFADWEKDMRRATMVILSVLSLAGCHRTAQPQATQASAGATTTAPKTTAPATGTMPPKSQSGQAMFNACGVPQGSKSQ